MLEHMPKFKHCFIACFVVGILQLCDRFALALWLYGSFSLSRVAMWPTFVKQCGYVAGSSVAIWQLFVEPCGYVVDFR